MEGAAMVLRSFSAIVILILYFLPASALSVTSSPPVVIGTSNSSLATAWNNARKIERTSDDIRLVVYQDSLADGPVVMWTFSADGIEWSGPAILGRGEFPALAIDEEDHFYAAWADADSPAVHIVPFMRDPSIAGVILPAEPVRVNMPLPSGFSLRHISLEASASGLHMAAEMIPAGSTRSQLYYAMFEKSDFSILCAFPFDHDLEGQGFDRSGFSARRPMITGDLEFKPGTLQIIYTDERLGGDWTEIGIILISEYAPPYETWEYSPVLLDARFPQELRGYSSPSQSFRSSGRYSGYFVLACSNEKNGTMAIGAGSIDLDDIFYLYTSFPENRGDALPSVDDIIPYRITCAVVWQDGGDIYYGQVEDGDVFHHSGEYQGFIIEPVFVGEANAVLKTHPSVCYRTFRGGLFDVIWTEGYRPPYKVMYRRMPKCYALNPIRFVSADIPRAALGFHYSGQIYTSGGSDDSRTYFEILEGRLPEGMGSFYYQNLQGTPKELGSFPFTLRVTDFARASSDTADFMLIVQKNTPHRLTSPETIQTERGSYFKFRPTVSDSESNPITYDWPIYPQWLEILNNRMLVGTVPQDAVDTSFSVIAFDGEFEDTLTVRIQIVTAGFSEDAAVQSVPRDFFLSPNFPNPFNPTTTIRFGLPASGKVQLELIGLKGELKKRMLDGTLNAGWHSVTVNGTDLPSGTYLIRLSAGGRSAVRKCVLLK
jgi:hypothetical protein